MREIARIPIILNKLKNIWEKNPDWRFMQLITNLFKTDDFRGYVAFYLEDDEFLKLIEVLENES